ncbi:MAG: pentapeptide repeat-containing protein [Scytonema sp. PMC 1069.18]|nr:pentapeptide repeat-containing protein [Scytonema sp. PMC 1069.18]MEC4880152.1 pentapeptide repeat-containing protein [Scytonema sp. PMC 1070.18]
MTQPIIPEELTKLFQAIDEEPTGKLSELARIAGLNLAEDYIGADLSGEDLSRDNLSHADLSGANLHNANLRETNLTGAILNSANLQGADLRNADLSNANLSDADLSSANLSNANLFRANLNNANLTNANLSHVNFRGANLLRTKNLSTANLVDTILTRANLGLSQKEMLSLKLRGAIIEDITVIGVQYNLTNAKFSGGFAATGGDRTGETLYDYSSNLSLAKVAAERQLLRQLLLRQLEVTNSTTISKANVNLAPLIWSRFREGNFCEATTISKEIVNLPPALVPVLLFYVLGKGKCKQLGLSLLPFGQSPESSSLER